MMVRNSVQLSELLRDLVHEGTGPVVIQAGHYALDIVDGEVTERLDEHLTSALVRSFAAFARGSWSIACELVSGFSRAQVSPGLQMMILVNDWQFNRWSESDRRAQEKRASEARRRYYAKVSTLPSLHTEVLRAYGLGESSIFKNSEERWLFSEDDLRRGLASTLKRLRAQGRSQELGLVETTTQAGEPVIRVRSPLDHEVCLLYCGNANCAGEVVELLRRLRQRGVSRFVNLFPRECMVPVEAGTTVAHDLFVLDGMQIVNAGLSVQGDGASVELEGVVSVHDF